MGLFGGTSTYLNITTTVSRVIPDGLIPNSVRTGLVKALFNSTDLVDSISGELRSSIALKAEQLYDYAEREYVYGSPSGELSTTTDGVRNGSFFPFIYFRYNSQVQHAEPTLVKLTEYLGVNFINLRDAVNANPDIGSIEEALIVMAVPANSTNPTELKYLYMFFDTVYKADPLPIVYTGARDSFIFEDESYRSGIVIQDRRYKMILSNTGLVKSLISLVIGPVDTYSMRHEFQYHYEERVDIHGDRIQVYVKDDTHYYYHQVTADQCQQIAIQNLEIIQYVYEFPEFPGYFWKAAGNERDASLLIPLDYSLTRIFLLTEREVLYARSLHFMFNGAQFTTVSTKWYQSALFLDIVMIVAFYFSITTFIGSPAMQAATAAGVTAVYQIFIKHIIIQAIAGVAISYAVQAVVKEIGVELTILLLLVSVYYGRNTALFKEFVGELTPVKLLGAVTSIIQAGVKVAQAGLEAIQNEIQSVTILLDEEAEKRKEIEEQDLVRSQQYKTLARVFVRGETPTEYFLKSLCTNPGQLSLDLPNRYVAMALTLPRFNDLI